MRQRFTIALVAILAVLGLGVATAGSAQAISRSTIDLSYVNAHVHYLGSGQYSGDILAKTSICVHMERKGSDGFWRDTGFWQGQFNPNRLESCNGSGRESWTTHEAPVYGLRVTDGDRIATFCDSPAECHDV
jgi:hypothetical protein